MLRATDVRWLKSESSRMPHANAIRTMPRRQRFREARSNPPGHAVLGNYTTGAHYGRQASFGLRDRNVTATWGDAGLSTWPGSSEIRPQVDTHLIRESGPQGTKGVLLGVQIPGGRGPVFKEPSPST